MSSPSACRRDDSASSAHQEHRQVRAARRGHRDAAERERPDRLPIEKNRACRHCLHPLPIRSAVAVSDPLFPLRRYSVKSLQANDSANDPLSKAFGEAVEEWRSRIIRGNRTNVSGTSGCDRCPHSRARRGRCRDLRERDRERLRAGRPARAGCAIGRRCAAGAAATARWPTISRASAADKPLDVMIGAARDRRAASSTTTIADRLQFPAPAGRRSARWSASCSACRDRTRPRRMRSTPMPRPRPSICPGWEASNPLDLPASTRRRGCGSAMRPASRRITTRRPTSPASLPGAGASPCSRPSSSPISMSGRSIIRMAGPPSSMVDPEAPDLERYPRFAEALAHAQVAELEPGDAIFIPAIWWHHVRAFDRLNVLVNYWWEHRKRRGVRRAGPRDEAVRDLPPREKAAWRAGSIISSSTPTRRRPASTARIGARHPRRAEPPSGREQDPAVPDPHAAAALRWTASETLQQRRPHPLAAVASIGGRARPARRPADARPDRRCCGRRNGRTRPPHLALILGQVAQREQREQQRVIGIAQPGRRRVPPVIDEGVDRIERVDRMPPVERNVDARRPAPASPSARCAIASAKRG